MTSNLVFDVLILKKKTKFGKSFNISMALAILSYDGGNNWIQLNFTQVDSAFE